ncbi:type II toxin-antitoxin system Phd/YefM family antitoxin [Streptomyces sp. NPDC059398]|uniref:type II toxin-antitoxin system Phd/YefM family antitoxin n=1 Tax=Streptomyces sp. NPDC059398 TaxID=3346820 RepID=UPI0036AD55F4
MEATAREFNQNSSRILAAAERGESVTVTKNGRPVAVLRPIDCVGGAAVPPYPDDPMGEDADMPVFGEEDGCDEPVDWTKGRSHYLKGFGG